MSENFAIVNLGCRVNRVESDTLSARLIAAGATRTSLQEAEVVVVNTCTVTGEATHKARKAVRHALEHAPSARIIATGCAVAIDPDMFQSLSHRVIVEANKEDAGSLALSLLGLEEQVSALPAFARKGEGFLCRAGIKIQDGCANACTYCIVHTARGPVWSKPAQEVLAEVVAAEEAGVREIVLTGINLGVYYDEGLQLAPLLSKLLDATTELRIRISSIEPPEVTDDLIALMAQSEGRVCRHFHLPLQSGSSRVLAAMDRRYDAAGFTCLADKLRSQIPDISLSTDIMVAFPGETKEDFQQTLDMARYAAFSKIHAFRFSPRPGTPAATMDGQIPSDTSAQRARELRVLGDTLRQNYRKSPIDQREAVLVEGEGKGTCERFLPAVIEGGEDIPAGSLVDVKITGVSNGLLTCQVIP